MTAVTQALHTAILVSDLDRAAEFYETVLGLPTAPRSLNFPGRWYQIGAFQLHLMVCDGWQAPRPRPDKWGRNPHLALQVSDLTALKEHLLAQDYPIQMSASGRAALFTSDPDGNIIELSQAESTA